MSARLVSIIYFYLISSIAIILLVIGVYNAVTFSINTLVYDKYPLRWGGGDRCAYVAGQVVEGPVPAQDTKSIAPTLSPEDQKEQQKRCEEALEDERKQHMIEDIRNAIAFTLIGGILFAIHFPIALRRSNVPK